MIQTLLGDLRGILNGRKNAKTWTQLLERLGREFEPLSGTWGWGEIDAEK